MSLEYLAKYLTKEKKSTKRKRKDVMGKEEGEDDFSSGWNNDNSDDENPMVVGDTQMQKSGRFRPAYNKVPEVADEHTSVPSTLPDSIVPSKGGLQTKAQIAAEVKRKEDAQRLEYERMMRSGNTQQHETVYRDATGRRIDIALAKREKAREVAREEEKKRKQAELGKGLVQQRAQEARQAELAQVRTEGFSRYAGHAEAEKDAKNKTHWNDPSAQFLSKSTDKHARPMYKGGFAANRFGIRPGYRWDGVDRGNGFEAKRFKAIAELQHKKNAYDRWSKEDM